MGLESQYTSAIEYQYWSDMLYELAVDLALAWKMDWPAFTLKRIEDLVLFFAARSGEMRKPLRNAPDVAKRPIENETELAAHLNALAHALVRARDLLDDVPEHIDDALSRVSAKFSMKALKLSRPKAFQSYWD